MPTPPLQRNAPLQLVTLALFAAAGVEFAYPMVIGGSFVFSSIAVLVAVRRFGPVVGALVGVPAGIYAWWVTGQPLLLLLTGAEALAVGWGTRRCPRRLPRGERLVVADLLFWLLLGIPLGGLLATGTTAVDGASLALGGLKLLVNGVFNAAAASWLLSAWLLFERYRRGHQGASWNMRDLLFDVLLAALFVPALVLTFWQGSSRFHDLEAGIVERLHDESTHLAEQLGNWFADQRDRLLSTAELALRAPAEGRSALARLRREAPLFAAVGWVGAEGEMPLPARYVEDLRLTADAGRDGAWFTPRFVTEAGEPVRGWVSPWREGRQLYAVLLERVLCEQTVRLSDARRMAIVLQDGEGRALECGDTGAAPTRPGPDAAHGRRHVHHSVGRGVAHVVPARLKENAPAALWQQSSYVREQPLGGAMPWRLVLEYPARAFHAEVQQLYLSGFLVSAFSALFAVLAAGFGSRGVAGHLSRLAEATAGLPDRVKSGAADGLPDSGITEVARLIQNFRRTAARLRSTFAELGEITANLEQRVAMRTRALEESNRVLRLEVRERRRAEERLRLASRVIENTSEGVIVTDSQGVIEFTNPAFTAITGYSAEEAVGRTPALLHSGRQGEAFYRQVWQALEEHHHWAGQLWNRRKNGEVYPEWLDISAITDATGAVEHYVGLFTDITEQEAAKAQLNELAYYDELTGLPNRRLMQDRLVQAMASAERQERLLAVLFIDLDRFKVVNDTLGHRLGDRLLEAVAVRLRSYVRRSDTLARLGGDEFVLLATDLDGMEAIAAVAQKLLELFEASFGVGGRELFITPSIGISVFPLDADDDELLLRNADIAMYRAKESGRAAYRFYAAAMNARAEERLELEHALRLALRREELVLHYQPQVELESGRLVGMEALVRWEHPERGMVPPGDFIPIAEESGLIVPIGAVIVRAACRQLRLWREAGLQPVRLALNLSPKQFIGTDLRATIATAAAAEGVDPALLELELTESVFIDDTLTVDRLLRELKGLGATLAIDDFGTGYSSMKYLKHFPVDALKIDRSFVQEITSNPDDAAIVAAIITVAHTLGLRVVAEGVETAAQLSFLTRRGCDEVQGFLVGRPAPAQVASGWLGGDVELLAPARPAPARERPRVLVVDSEERVRHAIARELSREGIDVIGAADEAAAFEALACHTVHVAIVEYRLEQADGIALLAKMHRLYPATVRLLITGYTNLRTVTDAVNRGHVYQFLTKPWDKERLRAAVQEGLVEYARQLPAPLVR